MTSLPAAPKWWFLLHKILLFIKVAKLLRVVEFYTIVPPTNQGGISLDIQQQTLLLGHYSKEYRRLTPEKRACYTSLFWMWPCLI